MYLKADLSGGRILRVIVTDLFRQLTSDWLSGFRFMNIFMSKLLFLLFSWRPLGLTGIYKIGIGVFFHADKVAGAINWTSISNYDQSWESICIPIKFHCVALRYCNVNLLFVSVEVGTGAPFRAEIGRVVVFNTHSYLALSLDMSRAMPLLFPLC